MYVVKDAVYNWAFSLPSVHSSAAASLQIRFCMVSNSLLQALRSALYKLSFKTYPPVLRKLSDTDLMLFYRLTGSYLSGTEA